jgi:hypothetical protein
MSGNTFRWFDGDSTALLRGHAGGDDASCFADEVVVDFPSMASAVDRIRHGFRADEVVQAMSMAITLSRQEAWDGAVVTLKVPVRRTCGSCGGRGEVWAEQCVACAGSGNLLLQRPVQLSVPPGVIDGTRLLVTLARRHALPMRIEVHVLVT